MSSYKILKEDGGYLLLETGEFLLQDPPILIDVSDSVLILETVFLNNAYEIDDVLLTENIEIHVDPAGISLSDNVFMDENIGILHDVWYSNIFENIAIAESIVYDWPLVVIVNDSVSVQENTSTQSIRYSSDNRKPRWPNGGVSGSISLIE